MTRKNQGQTQEANTPLTTQGTTTEHSAASGFGEHIGLQIDKLEQNRSVLSLQVQDHHLNMFGMVHGGVLLAMLDQTCGASMKYPRPINSQQLSVTIDLHTNFLSPARIGVLKGNGRCLKKGRSIAFCEAEIINEEGTIVATAKGSFKLFAQK